MTGGVVGSFFTSLTKGVSRGIFSNEAGLGIGSIAHACADTKRPVKQGFFGIFEVFTSTYGNWVSIVGATVDLGLVWSISETFNGLMVIPNLIAVFLLSGTVFKLVKEYLGEK